MVNAPIRTLVALDAGVVPEDVDRIVPSDDQFHVVGIVEGIEESWRTLQDAQVDLLLVACRGHSDRVLYLIDGAVKESPTLPVVVLSESSPNGFIRRVFEAGADDILQLPQTREDVRFALQKALARKLGALGPGGSSLGQLAVVLGPKGGTGKTLTASNLAVVLAQRGERTAIVDIDLQFGDVALCMGLPPEPNLYDLAHTGGSLDAEKLEAYLVRHPSGVDALLAPNRPDRASAITVELIRELFGVLRANHDFVIVDTPPGFTAEVITAIDASTDLVMVGMLDSLSLKNTKLGLETLELMGYNPARIKLVLNRAHSKVGISLSDVVAVLGREPDAFVPSDRDIPRAINEGVPIALAHPESIAAASFRALAADLSPLPVGEAPPVEDEAAETRTPERRRLFGRRG